MVSSASSSASSRDPRDNSNSAASASAISVVRTALVAFSPAQMYALVADVERYPSHFDWCDSAQVVGSGDSLQATLTLRVLGMSLSFTTENRGDPPARLDLRLVEGPFRSLDGHWQFDPIGDAGCRVTLDLSFDVGPGMLGHALALGFRAVADRMVDDFCRAARRLYANG